MSSLTKKLNAIYTRIGHIDKAGENKKQGYKFVRSADVLRAIRKAFAELGIYAPTNYTLLGTYDIRTNSGGIMHTATVRAEIQLIDIETGESLTISGLGDGADSGDKGIYKAQTGATKNALRNSFLVPDEADPEADETVDEETQEVPHKTPRQVIAQLKEEPAPFFDGPLPTAEELEKYRVAITNLTKELSESGELKASRGQHVGSKVLAFILKTTKAPNAQSISINQWEKLLSEINIIKSQENGLKALAKLINEASKEKNHENQSKQESSEVNS